jgi:hypothetical protein
MEKNGQFLLSKNETLGDPVFAATEICWREMVQYTTFTRGQTSWFFVEGFLNFEIQVVFDIFYKGGRFQWSLFLEEGDYLRFNFLSWNDVESKFE